MTFASVLAFEASSFFETMGGAALLAAIFYVAARLLTPDKSEQKIAEIGTSAIIFGVLYWLVSMVPFLSWLQGLMQTVGIVWLCYKWLDFSLLRSLGVMAVILATYLVLIFILATVIFSIH